MAIKSIHDFIKSLKASLPASLNAFLYLSGVGSKSFVENIKEKLGIRAKGRKVGKSGELYHLREAQVPYNSDLRDAPKIISFSNRWVESYNFRDDSLILKIDQMLISDLFN